VQVCGVCGYALRRCTRQSAVTALVIHCPSLPHLAAEAKAPEGVELCQAHDVPHRQPQLYAEQHFGRQSAQPVLTHHVSFVSLQTVREAEKVRDYRRPCKCSSPFRYD
jgi:hypothetical protein